MTFKTWLHDTGIKAINTCAQTAVALLGVDQTKWLNADFKTIALASGMAGVVTILHHLAELGGSAAVTVGVVESPTKSIERI